MFTVWGENLCGAKTYVGPLEVHKEMEKSPKCIDTHSIIRVLGSYPFHSSYWNYLEPEQPLYEALRTS